MTESERGPLLQGGYGSKNNNFNAEPGLYEDRDPQFAKQDRNSTVRGREEAVVAVAADAASVAVCECAQRRRTDVVVCCRCYFTAAGAKYPSRPPSTRPAVAPGALVSSANSYVGLCTPETVPEGLGAGASRHVGPAPSHHRLYPSPARDLPLLFQLAVRFHNCSIRHTHTHPHPP